MTCRICGDGSLHKVFMVKEMMFGTGEYFEYMECCNCECLQIKEPPEDMARYYPHDYYSFRSLNGRSGNYVKRYLLRARDRYAVFEKGLLGKIVYGVFPSSILNVLSALAIDKNASILDVGSGSGDLLTRLRGIGYRDLKGIDLYIDKEIHEKGFDISKKPISDMRGEYNLIIFCHSIEHMSDPIEVLGQARKLMKDDGICLISTPLADSWAYENYGTNWVQIDAPRHLFVYSRKSIKMMCEKMGFKVYKCYYDSTAFQFWGSEQYKRGIALRAANSYDVAPHRSIFSKKEIMAFSAKANILNRKCLGDQAIFCLKKV